MGPSREFTADLIVEDDAGAEVSFRVRQDFMVVDVSDFVLSMLRDYDPVTDSTEEIVGFSSDRSDTLIADVLAQIQMLASQQEAMNRVQGQLPSSAAPAIVPETGVPSAPKLPSLSAGYVAPPADVVQKAVSLIGPPPKTKAVSEQVGGAPGVELGKPMIVPDLRAKDTSSVVAAISQQSAALTTLVAHLASGDALLDLQGSSTSSSVSTKGVARRERMQQDLANRSSQYFLQVQQQLFKKPHPSRVCLRTEEELMRSGVSMTTYLENHGTFQGQKENGMIMWMLAHAMDSASQGDFYATKEFLALLYASMDQAVLDGHCGTLHTSWDCWKNPQGRCAERRQSGTSLGKPFGPLVPPSWAAVLEEVQTNPKANPEVPSSPSDLASQRSQKRGTPQKQQTESGVW